MGNDKSKERKEDIPGLPERTKISEKEMEWVEKTVINENKKKKRTIRKKRDVDYNDEVSVLKEMETNTGNLAFANQKLRKDKNFMLEAIKNDPFTFMYADDRLKRDKEFVKLVIQNSFTQIINHEEREYVYRFLGLIDLELKLDLEVSLEIVNRFPFVLKKGKFVYIASKEFYLDALARNPICVRYMNKVFGDSKEYQRLSAIQVLESIISSPEYAYNSFRYAGVCEGEEGNQLMWFLLKLIMSQSDSYEHPCPRKRELKYQVKIANLLFDLYEKFDTYEFNRVPNQEWDIEKVKESMVHVINSCIRNIDLLIGSNNNGTTKGMEKLQEVCDSSSLTKFAECVVKVFKKGELEEKNIRHKIYSYCSTILVRQFSGMYLSFFPELEKILKKYESQIFGFGEEEEENTELPLVLRTRYWFERNMKKLEYIKLWKERRRLMEIKLRGEQQQQQQQQQQIIIEDDDNTESQQQQEEQIMDFEEEREVFIKYFNELQSLYLDDELRDILEKYNHLLDQYKRDLEGIVTRHHFRNEDPVRKFKDLLLDRITTRAHKLIKTPLDRTKNVINTILVKENEQVMCIFDFWRGINRMDEDIKELGSKTDELASGLDNIISKYEEALISFKEWKNKVMSFSLRKRIRELDTLIDSSTSLSPEHLENNISLVESKNQEIKENIKTLSELEKIFLPFFTDENDEVSKSLQIHRTELEDQYHTLEKEFKKESNELFGEAIAVDHKNSLQKSFDEFSNLLSLKLGEERCNTLEVILRQSIRMKKMEQRFASLFYWFRSRSGYYKYKKDLVKEYELCAEGRIKNSLKVMKMFWKGCELSSRKREIRNEKLELGQKLFKVKMEISHLEHNTKKNGGMFGIVPVKKKKKKKKVDLKQKVKEEKDEEEEEEEEEEECEGEEEEEEEEKEKDPNKKLVELYVNERDLGEKTKKIEQEEELIDWRVERIKLMVRILEKKTFSFLRSELERKQKEEHPKGLSNEKQFEEFLKNHNVFVERDISMKYYEGVKRLHGGGGGGCSDLKEELQSEGALYFAKLKTDWAKEPKILKIINSSAQTRIRTENEISTLSEVQNHPSIAKVNHVFLFKNKIAMEMEYYRTDLLRWLKGYTFQKDLLLSSSSSSSNSSSSSYFTSNNNEQFIHRLRRKKSVRKKNKIVEVFRRVLEGICFLHKMGIQHGDLRPRNILMNDEDHHLEVKIISFGKSRNSKRTFSSVLMSVTPETKNCKSTSQTRYQSPEEIREFGDLKQQQQQQQQEEEEEEDEGEDDEEEDDKEEDDEIIGLLKKETFSNEDYESRDIFSFGMMVLEVMTEKKKSDFEKEVMNGELRMNISEEGGLYDIDSGTFNDSLWMKLGIKDEKVKEVLQHSLVPDPSKRYSSTELLQKCGLFNSVMVDDFDLKKLIRKENIMNIKEKMKTLQESTEAGIRGNNNNNNRRNYSWLDNGLYDNSVPIIVNVDRRSPHTIAASSSSNNHRNNKNKNRRKKRRRKRGRIIEEEEEEEEEESKKRKDVVINILKQVLDRGVVKDIKDLVRRVSCQFEGESAVDAGGVTREMFSTLFQQVASYGYCDRMGRNTTNNSVYYLPTDHKDHSEIFNLLGILCFRCLLHNNCFRVSFPPFFYSFILGKMPKTREDWFQHCKFCAPDCIPLIEKTLFSSSFEYIKGDTFEDDNNNEFELKKSNKMDYLLYKVKTKLRGAKGVGFRMKNMESFKKGFFSFIPQNMKLEIQNILNPFELDTIVYGQRYLSEKVFFDNIRYESGFGHTVDQYMKLIFKGKDDKKRWEFIQFCTGSSDIVDGKLMKGPLPHKIEVKRSLQKDYFKAATCFYKLHVGFNFENEKFEVFNAKINLSLDYLRLGDMQE